MLYLNSHLITLNSLKAYTELLNILDFNKSNIQILTLRSSLYSSCSTSGDGEGNEKESEDVSFIRSVTHTDPELT